MEKVATLTASQGLFLTDVGSALIVSFHICRLLQKRKRKRIGSIETQTYWSTTFSTCANLTCCLATGIDRAIRSGAARSNDIVVDMYGSG